MRRALAFATAAELFFLAGCAVSPPDNSLAYRAGTGSVEAVKAARVAVPRRDGSSPLDDLFRPRWTEGHQLTLRMDDGSSQQVTQDRDTFKVGERVEITADGHVLRATSGKTPARAGYRPGTGVVEVVRPARVAAAPSGSQASASDGAIIGSQAAGGGYGTPVERLFRSESSAEAHQLVVKMDDGTRQHVTQESAAFQPGDRVAIHADGRVIKTMAAASTPVPAAPQASHSANATRPGVGVIESASVVSLPSTGAAAGGTAARGPTMAYAVKMPDGSTQSVVQAGERFQLGDRVQVTSEGRLVRP